MATPRSAKVCHEKDLEHDPLEQYRVDRSWQYRRRACLWPVDFRERVLREGSGARPRAQWSVVLSWQYKGRTRQWQTLLRESVLHFVAIEFCGRDGSFHHRQGAAFGVEPHAKHAGGEVQQNPSAAKGLLRRPPLVPALRVAN